MASRRGVRGVLFAGLLALAFAWAEPAAAGNLSLAGPYLGFSTWGGERNSISVSQVGLTITVTDSTTPIVAGGGCSNVTANSATCPAMSLLRLDFWLNDLNDSFTSTASVPVSVDGGDGNDTITGSPLDDYLSGGAGNDSVFGGGGNDGLSGGDGDDNVQGGSGDDKFYAGYCGYIGCPADGADVYDGGAGTDWVLYFARAAGVHVSLDGVANDGAPGEGDRVLAVENVQGGYGDDVLTGDSGPNVLDGGWTGADVFSGGGGIDTVDYSEVDDDLKGVNVSLDDVANDGPPGLAPDNVHSDVENIRGTDHDDHLVGNGADNVIDGSYGTDSIDGLAGTDTVSYATHLNPVSVTLDGIDNDGMTGEQDHLANIESIIGGALDDFLAGNAGANTLNGGPGDDVLQGAAGTDTMIGGTGFDIADYGDHTAAVTADLDGVAGDDGAAGENDTIGADVEGLAGGAGDDVLAGSSDDNVLQGAAGEDTLNGGGGDDELQGGEGADVLNGGTGEDTADYADHTSDVSVDLDSASRDDGAAGEGDTVARDVEDVVGGSGDDQLVGNDGPNTLDGGPGDDVLGGGLGADTLVGGPGIDDTADYSGRASSVTVALNGTATSGVSGEHDTIETDVEDAVGGSGNDTFIGSSADNIFDGGPGADTFTGGEGFDAVDYSTRAEAVTVTLDATGNDGAAGEGDNVAAGMEDAYGGSGDDHVTGDENANLFVGGPGADVIDGAGGDDLLFGQAGPDTITGGAGDDLMDAGSANDTIQSRDGTPEDVFCGDGTDTVTPDADDTTTDCEILHVPTSLAVTAALGTYHGTANLAATLKRDGDALPGKTITFSVLGTIVGTATTTASGATTLAQVSLGNAPPGFYSAGLTATFAGDDSSLPSSASAGLTVTKATQTILFDAVAAKTFSDPDFAIHATATSGLAVSVSATGKCTVSGNAVHLTGAGSCTLTASQLGDADWLAATKASQTFTIAKAPQTITFDAVAAKTLGDPDFPVDAKASSGLAVAIAVTGNCTITGSIVHLTAAGSCSLTASQPGDANWLPATSLSQTFTIAQSSTSPPTKPTQQCRVPKVVGKTLSYAKSALKRTHCATGKVSYAYSKTTKRGRVIAQSTRPGRVLRAGSKVNLVISKGRKP